jgi:sugar phosphate isomerase/epimerase
MYALKISQVVAQLYTLKGFTEDERQIATALRRVRAMGYTAVQVSGLGPIDVEKLAKLLNDEGLACVATHEPADTVLNNPEAVVERLAKLRCKYTAYPYPAGIDFSSSSVVASFIAKLDRAGRILADAGQVLCYHNHHLEFRKLDGKLILDLIYDRTDPRYLQGEIDTYWVQYGGGSPLDWCRKLKGRMPLIHLKDYFVDAENKVGYTDIGAGNLDFAAIIAEAERSGCEWFIVERDPSPGDPFDSLKASYNYLRDVICA